MERILRDLSGNRARLDLDHLEIVLARTTVRTGPVFGNVLPACAWGNPILWPSFLFVVNQSTHDTHPGLVFHVFIHLYRTLGNRAAQYRNKDNEMLFGGAADVLFNRPPSKKG